MEGAQEAGSGVSGQQRVSFSSFLETEATALEEEGGSLSDSGEFEFRNPLSVETEEDSTSGGGGRGFPADELFYNGKMLPLEPLSRMAMVKDLNAVVRRGRSAPPSPYIDPCSSGGTAGGTRSTTRKSSSYPPRNRGSSRFKDFFGALKKNNSSGGGQEPNQPPIKPPASSAAASSSNKFFRNVLNFGKREAGKGQNPSSKQQQQQLLLQSQHNQQQNMMNVAVIGRRNRAVFSAGDFTRSAPATPLHPRASAATNGFAPVLHLPLPKFLSHKTIEVL